eukprot:121992-Amorphochlora_amoeboformis.AAC.1
MKIISRLPISGIHVCLSCVIHHGPGDQAPHDFRQRAGCDDIRAYCVVPLDPSRYKTDEIRVKLRGNRSGKAGHRAAGRSITFFAGSFASFTERRILGSQPAEIYTNADFRGLGDVLRGKNEAFKAQMEAKCV